MSKRTKTAALAVVGAVGKGGVNPAPGRSDETVRVAAEQLVLLPVESLRPYEKNARVHSKAQLLQLRASLREFGFITPLVVDFDYNVIAGHGRLEAAKAEGMETVPCVLVSNLTEAQRRAFVLADNKLAESADWDMALVELEMTALSALDFDVNLTGFAPVELSMEAPPALKTAQATQKPRGRMTAPKACICPECGYEFAPGGTT